MFDVRLDDVCINSVQDVRPAAERLKEIVDDLLGFRVALCHDIAVRQPMRDEEGEILATSVFGWTNEERDRWWCTPNLALISPLPTACRYESEPFWCNSQGFFCRTPNPMLDALDRKDFERRGQAAAAIVVPVHLPFGRIGAASFAPWDRSHTDLREEFEIYGDTLGLLGRTFISSYVKTVCMPPRSLPVGPLLSKREVECLRWAAVGKTDEEISMIISRARATVRFHIQKASVKLDAVNRSQTIFKAGQLGYISIN